MNNEKKMNVLGWIVKLVVAIPALFFTFIIITSGVDANSDQLVIHDFMNGIGFQGFSFSAAMDITIIAILIAVALILLFFILLLISRPVYAIKSIAGILVSAILFLILYFAGTTDTAQSLQLQGSLNPTPGELAFTNAGLWTSVIILIVCCLIAVFMRPVMKLFKK